jgi:drug/metabolite transporter (DMT)-like permease
MNNKLQTNLSYTIPALIWGSTWYAIKFQLGVVNPLMSVSYRFMLAGIVLLGMCTIYKLELKFTRKAHLMFFIQGLTLFGFNYWLVYLAEQYLTSGFIAVIFSLIIFSNMIFGALFLRSRITWQIVIGGILAIGGTFLIFRKEFVELILQGVALEAILMSIGSLILASLGNVLSAYNQKQKLPVIQTNAFGMLYGAVSMFVFGLIKNIPVTFDFHISYLTSLLYLAVFGSVIAFNTYLKLLGKIGPAKAAYILVIVPVIAMVFSTFFESYVWKSTTIVGITILILGNLIALDKIKPEKIIARWK